MSEENKEKPGALWKRASKKGTTFLSGEINGVQVVIFKTKEKRTEKSPDYVVFKSEQPAKSEAPPDQF